MSFDSDIVVGFHLRLLFEMCRGRRRSTGVGVRIANTRMHGVTEVSTLLIGGGKTLAEGFEEVQPCAHSVNPDGAVKGKVGAFLGTAPEAGAHRDWDCAKRPHHA